MVFASKTHATTHLFLYNSRHADACRYMYLTPTELNYLSPVVLLKYDPIIVKMSNYR